MFYQAIPDTFIFKKTITVFKFVGYSYKTFATIFVKFCNFLLCWNAKKSCILNFPLNVSAKSFIMNGNRILTRCEKLQKFHTLNVKLHTSCAAPPYLPVK